MRIRPVTTGSKTMENILDKHKILFTCNNGKPLYNAALSLFKGSRREKRAALRAAAKAERAKVKGTTHGDNS